MSFDLQKIISEMNIFAISVVVVLAIMAMATLSVLVERWWAYWRTGRRSKQFGPTAAKLLRENNHARLITATEEAPPSYLASMLNAGVKSYVTACKNPSSDVTPVELTRRELARKGDAQAAKLRRGLSILASVGSTAPFVGLLGTVIGIIAAFQGIAAEGSGGLGAVSAGIAEALVVTAFGLMVAIPATLTFNFLSTKSDALMLSLDQAQGELVDHIEAHHSTSFAELNSASASPDIRSSAAA